jgi:hypothetical protein
MVTDGQGGSSAAATLALTFVPENDALDLTVVTFTVEWTGIRYSGENPPTVESFSKILQPTLNLTDRDNVTLASATVVILNGQVGPGGYRSPRHPVQDRDASACIWRHLAFALARPPCHPFT